MLLTVMKSRECVRLMNCPKSIISLVLQQSISFNCCHVVCLKCLWLLFFLSNINAKIPNVLNECAIYISTWLSFTKFYLKGACLMSQALGIPSPVPNAQWQTASMDQDLLAFATGRIEQSIYRRAGTAVPRLLTATQDVVLCCSQGERMKIDGQMKLYYD